MLRRGLATLIVLALVMALAVASVEAGELRFNLTSPSSLAKQPGMPLSPAERAVEYGAFQEASLSLELPPGVYEVVMSTPSGSSRPLTVEVSEGVTVVNLTVKPAGPQATLGYAGLAIHPAILAALILAGSAGLAGVLASTVKNRV